MAATHVTKETLAELTQRIQDLYLLDQVPWVVGYSGGKDSTATLQLVWRAVAKLPVAQRQKAIHVISTDTLVEQPIVAAWVNNSLELMAQAAREQDMPIQPHRLTPETKNTFWVNLIGKGYPAPRRNFRWCTSRMKIDPSNRFIQSVVARHGEAVLVLGTRKAESQQRADNMERYERKRVRESLSPNGNLPNSLIFTPMEDWSSDDVWLYLMQARNPWGVSNKDLMSMYRGASADNECPLVVDSSTPSCGNSRFGCWVCTVVSQDKSMEAMIQNDWEKAWMTPLLQFRNEIGQLNENGVLDDWDRRDFRRIHGRVEMDKKGRIIHGPYTKDWRERWLRRLLEVEVEVQRNGPKAMGELRLITDEELREIRRIWVEDKHEFDDALPRIYTEVTGRDYPYEDDIKRGPFGPVEWKLLQDLCGEDRVLLQLQASLLDVEQRTRGLARRRGIYEELEGVMKQAYYSTEEEALVDLRRRTQRRSESGEPLSLQALADLEEAEGYDIE